MTNTSRITTKAAGVFVLDNSYTILREPGNLYGAVFMYEGILSAKEREQSMSYLVLDIPKSKELDADTIIAAAVVALKTRAEHEASLEKRK